MGGGASHDAGGGTGTRGRLVRQEGVYILRFVDSGQFRAGSQLN